MNHIDQHNGRRELLSEDQFRNLVLYECARCDRNCHQFSLVQIELQKETDRRAETGLIKKILQRIRTTDEAGWLGDNCLGVFLPETDRNGAKIFAKNVCNGYSYQIYTYPNLTPFKEDKPSYEGDDKNSGDGEKDQSRSEKSWINDSCATDCSMTSQRAAVTQELETVLHPVKMPFWKRIIDIIGSVIALILLSPVFLVVALYIKIVSRGPVLFRQERVGYLGRPFTIWKFRTMKVDADCDVHKLHLKELIQGDQVLKKLDQEKDLRLIPMAGLLRKTCLDELPQLFNVLKGEMSLVGPRPVLYYEAEEFSPWERKRFHTMPGMTGLWQVSGKNRLTHSQMMRLDARYSQKCNLMMDLFIFFKTLPAILEQTWGSIGGRPSDGTREEYNLFNRRPLSELIRQIFL